jgi:hypothetical protein
MGRATRPLVMIANNAAEMSTVWGRPFLVMATGAHSAAS